MQNKELEQLEFLPEALKSKFDDKIVENWDDLMTALMDLARGIYREDSKVDNRTGVETIRIYKDKPDKEVAQYLVDRVLGKPKQKREEKENNDKPLVIQVSKEIADKYNVKPTSRTVASGAGGDSQGQSPN